MALADGAELIVLAPGVKGFGEDPTIGEMIRKYGYFGTPKTLEAVNNNADLKATWARLHISFIVLRKDDSGLYTAPDT